MSRPPIQFNHDVSDCGDFVGQVAGVEDYASRILPSSKPGDIVFVHERCKPHLDFVLRHYRQIGLKVGDVVWRTEHTAMLDYLETHQPSVFFYGNGAHKVLRDYEWHQVTKNMNDKNFATQFVFEALGVHSPVTLRFEDKRDYDGNLGFNFPPIHAPEQKSLKFPVVFKPATGATGIGIEICNTRDELEIVIGASSGPFQIQQYHHGIQFLNLQYRVINGKLERFIASEQVLDGNAHIGNRFPVNERIWKAIGKQMTADADKLANWMYKRGMKDYFAFDVLVSEKNDLIRYYFLECNPRYNGASYPSNVCERLGIKSWMHVNIKTRYRSFDGLDLTSLAYSKEKGDGVIIVNWGAVNGQKIGVLFAAPTVERQQQLKDELCKLIG